MYLCVYVRPNFLLSDQNGALVRHMSFQGKKIICSPGNCVSLNLRQSMSPEKTFPHDYIL